MPFVCEMNPIFCDLRDSGSLYRIVKKRLRWKQMDAAETILNSLNPRDIGRHMIGSHMEARIGT